MTDRTLREKIAALKVTGVGDQSHADAGEIALWNGAINKALAILDAHTAAQPAPDAVAEAPCRHEWYQGRCIHCEISVSDYRHAHSSPLIDASRRLLVIVEGINGAMIHGTWRDERGVRLKDTPEWVAFYNAVKEVSR